MKSRTMDFYRLRRVCDCCHIWTKNRLALHSQTTPEWMNRCLVISPGNQGFCTTQPWHAECLHYHEIDFIFWQVMPERGNSIQQLERFDRMQPWTIIIVSFATTCIVILTSLMWFVQLPSLTLDFYRSSNLLVG